MINNYSTPFNTVKYSCEADNVSTGMFSVNVSDANSNPAALLLSQQQQPHQQQHDQQSRQIDQQHDVDIKEHSNGKRKHCVWDYYDLINGKASCRACQRTISATTTLAKGHLKAFHPTLLTEVEQKEEHRKELNPTNATPKRRKTPQLQQHQQQIQQLQLLSNDVMGASRVHDKSYLRINDGYCFGKLTPTVRMSRTEIFSAAHRLHNPELSDAQNVETYGKCNNLNGHGHNYEWKVVLEGPVNVHTGMVYDLAELKRIMSEVTLTVDHKNLDLDNEYFRNSRLVSTTENLCVYLYHQIKSKLKPQDILKKVVICETNKNKFSYSGG